MADIDGIRIAFEQDAIVVRLDDLLPLRQMTPRIASSRKYGRIKKSILVIGLVEPLAVAKADKEGRRMLLDGHLRYHALREHGIEEARCIVADDDNTFTYNKRVNRLTTVQEQYVILRAIERGASEEKIAQALGIYKSALHRRKTLLSGISPEVANLLKDKNVNRHAFDVLRKMKPLC